MSWTAGILTLIGLWALGFALSRLNKNGEASNSKPSEAKESATDKEGKKNADSEKTPAQTKKGVSWWKRPVGLFSFVFIVTLAIFLGSWGWGNYGHKLDADSLGSGQMLMTGKTITIRKHKGNDFTKLEKYDTPIEGFPLTLDIGGQEGVMILIWEQVNNQWQLDTRGPIPFKGEPLSNCSVKTFSVFLGNGSRITQLKNVTASVDQTKRCDPLNTGEYTSLPVK